MLYISSFVLAFLSYLSPSFHFGKHKCPDFPIVHIMSNDEAIVKLLAEESLGLFVTEKHDFIPNEEQFLGYATNPITLSIYFFHSMLVIFKGKVPTFAETGFTTHVNEGKSTHHQCLPLNDPTLTLAVCKEH